MENNVYTVTSLKNDNVFIHAIEGHFITANTHLNCYVGTSDIKHHHRVSVEAAKLLAEHYKARGIDIDTILCLYETETLGAYLADELTKATMLSPNPSDDIYIVSPEYDATGNMIFRDNIRKMIENRKVLILMSCITSGNTVRRGMNCVKYYGGKTIAVSAAFSAISDIDGIEVNSIFTKDDLSSYEAYSALECPLCKQGKKIDALANGHGYSKL